MNFNPGKSFPRLAALWFCAMSCTVTAADSLRAQFQAGPMAGVSGVVFCARIPNSGDGHWYANIGYYAHDPNRKAWREGAKLFRLNLASGKLTTLLDDPRGGRDRSQAKQEQAAEAQRGPTNLRLDRLGLFTPRVL